MELRKKAGSAALPDGKYYWTKHAKLKMRFYGLSGQRVARVIRSPRRKEIGIVKDTVAVMQPVSVRRIDGQEKWSQEIWAMYRTRAKAGKAKSGSPEHWSDDLLKPGQLKIISAWRYPGMSPTNEPIPEDVLREIEEAADMV